MSLAVYFRRCNVTQFHTHSANTYDRRRVVQRRIDRLRADANTPEQTEVFLAFLTAAASRYPGSPLETAIPWPTAGDFGIMPADLEETCPACDGVGDFRGVPCKECRPDPNNREARENDIIDRVDLNQKYGSTL